MLVFVTEGDCAKANGRQKFSVYWKKKHLAACTDVDIISYLEACFSTKDRHGRWEECECAKEHGEIVVGRIGC